MTTDHFRWGEVPTCRARMIGAIAMALVLLALGALGIGTWREVAMATSSCEVTR